MRTGWRYMLTGALLAVLSLTGAPASTPASALKWVIAPERSQVLLDYWRNDKPAGGHFARFAGEGVFDLDAPGDATLELRIESGSIDLDNAFDDALVTSAEWFDSINHPLIVYRRLELTPEGGNRFLAKGELTIKGRTRPTENAITFEIGDDEALTIGSLRLNRKDYRLGSGLSSLFVKFGREVVVRIDLTAHPVR